MSILKVRNLTYFDLLKHDFLSEFLQDIVKNNFHILYRFFKLNNWVNCSSMVNVQPQIELKTYMCTRSVQKVSNFLYIAHNTMNFANFI